MKKLVAIGGGKIEKWNFETKDNQQEKYETKEIDEEIVRLSNKTAPKLLFIGTASRENPYYFGAIREIYNKLNCHVSELKVINEEITAREIEEKILNTDIIYIGGGNINYMLEEWKKHEIQTFLKKAYEKGIVMAGYSAGSYCMFEYNYELIEGMSFIPAINCVHYNGKSGEKRQQFKRNVIGKGRVGIALDNGVALEIIEDKYRIIKSINTAKAYKIDGEEEQEINNVEDFLETKDLLHVGKK